VKTKNEYMEGVISDFKQKAVMVISYFKEDLKSIRTGKSNPSLLENLLVETYGGQSKLKLMELATIVTEGPTALSVTPFDPSTLADIEKAILKSAFGISPVIQGTRIIAKIPPLSQEQRGKFVKVINQKAEERKNILRNYRDDVRKKIKQLSEAKEISEDIKFRLEKEIDAETQTLMEQLQKIREAKEKEIMEI